MGNFIKAVRRRWARKASASRRYPSSVRTAAASGRTAMHSRSSRGGSRSRSGGRGSALVLFLRRNFKLVAAGAFVLIAGVVCLIIFTGGVQQTSSPQVADVTATLPFEVATDYSEMESYAYEDVDEDVLAGLAGTDEDLFSDDADMEAELLAAEGVRIGVTVQSLPTDMDKALLGRMEALSAEAEQSERIYRTFYYNAGGSDTQQLQDVRSLINNEVDVIIVGATDADNFDMVCAMAAEAGIPVVAYDAPGTQGYAINVVTDQQAWGAVYGEFVAQQLTGGNVLQVLGSAESAVDQQRAAGISAALAGNPALVQLQTVYAAWDRDDAYAAVKALLEDGAVIDAVITEEGMAEGILDAFIEAGKFPQVMCGDVTAGFIKKWYALKRSGLSIEVEAQDDDEPAPTPMVMFAPPGTLDACAQPAPLGAGAVAFEIAVRMAEGRTLKAEGETFTYSVQTLITADNLSGYYTTVKDLDDSAYIADEITGAMLEDLFEPAEEE